MKKVLYALLLLCTSCAEIGGRIPPSELREKTLRFESAVAHAVTHYGRTEWIQTSVGIAEPDSATAGLQFKGRLFFGTYIIYVMPGFLIEASTPMIEHIAFHEVCHLVNGDVWKKKPEDSNLRHQREVEVELCIIKAVGREVYARYLHEYKSWKPEKSDFVKAREDLIFTMSRAFDGKPPLPSSSPGAR